MPLQFRRALLSVGLALSLALCQLSAAADELSGHIQLPATPSVLLTAPISAWKPVLDRLDGWMTAQASKMAKPEEQIQVLVQRTLVAQARRDWSAALTAVRAARALQPSASGRHTSGLLNELLALHAQGKQDSPWLREETRKVVLAMPWPEVEVSIRGLRQALVDMEAEGVRSHVSMKMDISTGVTQGWAAPGFVLQLLGLRFQLEQVLPQRPALILGLDDAIREREANR